MINKFRYRKPPQKQKNDVSRVKGKLGSEDNSFGVNKETKRALDEETKSKIKVSL